MQAIVYGTTLQIIGLTLIAFSIIAKLTHLKSTR